MLRQFRILLSILKGSLKREKKSALAPFISHFRVWPTDIDLSNVNQSIYLYYLELARWEWIFASQIRGLMKEFECLPITGTQLIRNLRPLKNLQKFRITSQLTHWDDKWLYIDQSILRGNEVIAVATIKGLFKAKKGLVATATLLKHAGLNPISPPLPPRFQLMNEMESDAIAHAKKST